MTLGAARTPRLLLAQLNFCKNTQKGPLPPTHQAPESPRGKPQPVPSRTQLSILFGGQTAPVPPGGHGSGEGGSTVPRQGCSWVSAGRNAQWGSSGPGASRCLRQGQRSRGRQRRGHRCSSGLSWQLCLIPPADVALTTKHKSLFPLHWRPGDWEETVFLNDPHLAQETPSHHPHHSRAGVF